MSASAIVFVLALMAADQQAAPGASTRNLTPDAGVEAAPASVGVTLDAATRERPQEVVCRDAARSTFSRIGSARTCRTRIEWARREANGRRFMDDVTNGGLGRHNRAPVGF